MVCGGGAEDVGLIKVGEVDVGVVEVRISPGLHKNT